MTQLSFPPTKEEIALDAEGKLIPPLSHGFCKSCGHCLDGGGIWEHFYKQNLREGMEDAPARIEADRVAEMYGASVHKGRWGLAIGIEDETYDGVSWWACSFCKAMWNRWTGELSDKKLEMPDA